jgi:hypothetical protein
VSTLSEWRHAGAGLTLRDRIPGGVNNAKPTYRAINVHAGGVAWYGNYLYVADTEAGLRVFDLRKIFDLDRSFDAIACW